MKHKMLGTLTWDTDLEWHVSLFNGKIKNSYKHQEEAVKFIEDELIRVMDDYGFEVCYRVENKVLARRSYVLISRHKISNKIVHTSLSRYEYAKTHFFFFSKDKRRKIFDYKNPDFNQLTRNCISTKKRVNTAFLIMMIMTIALLTSLLSIFMISLDNEMLLSIEATIKANPNHLWMIVALSIALSCSIIIVGIFMARFIRYNKLVKGGSTWHESYSKVDWRAFYNFVRVTRFFSILFTLIFTASMIMFGILFSKSSMSSALSKVEDLRIVISLFIIACMSVAIFGYITTYYIVKFKANLAAIAPAVLTDRGLVVYKSWLRGRFVSDEQERVAFHPVEDHMLYPNAEIINENPKYADMTDEQIKELRKDVENYRKLIYKDKFSKHGADKDELAKAKAKYIVW